MANPVEAKRIKENLESYHDAHFTIMDSVTFFKDVTVRFLRTNV